MGPTRRSRTSLLVAWSLVPTTLLALLLVVPARVEASISQRLRADLQDAGINAEEFVVDIDWRRATVTAPSSGMAGAAASVAADASYLSGSTARVAHDPDAEQTESLAIQYSNGTAVLSGSASAELVGEVEDSLRSSQLTVIDQTQGFGGATLDPGLRRIVLESTLNIDSATEGGIAFYDGVLTAKLRNLSTSQHDSLARLFRQYPATYVELRER